MASPPYVRTTLPSVFPEPDISSPAPDPTEVSDRELVTRVVYADTQPPDLVQLGAAHPNPRLAATRSLNRILASVARRMGDRGGMYDYMPGCEPLRIQVVELLAAHDIPLVENDIFGELHFGDRGPSVAKAYDRKGLIMLCSSFSKSLCPGYRVGWVVPGRHKTAVRWLKYTSTLATPTLAEYTLAEFLDGGGYDPYMRRTRRIYARHVAALSQAVQRYFPEECKLTRPAGGFLLRVQLPAQVDSLVLYRQALQAGIAITPGYLFSATNQFRDFIRLNAANWSDRAERAIEKLGSLIAGLAGQAALPGPPT